MFYKGTKLAKRLARGDVGINPLDNACKEHDIAYAQYGDISGRHKADKILAEKAWQRYKSKDATFGEKASALLITNTMKAKTKFGLGCGAPHRRRGAAAATRKPTFCKAIKKIRLSMRKNKKSKDIMGSIKLALKSAKKEMKNIILPSRIIPIPKTGGILPFLIPLFAGLSALGSLAGGTAGIVKTVNEFKDAKKRLKESERHNGVMESVMLQNGKGLYLKPYKRGLGLFFDSKN